MCRVSARHRSAVSALHTKSHELRQAIKAASQQHLPPANSVHNKQTLTTVTVAQPQLVWHTVLAWHTVLVWHTVLAVTTKSKVSAACGCAALVKNINYGIVWRIRV